MTFAVLVNPPVFAATNSFITLADTSLLEVAPTNNHGGFIGMNSGTTQNFKRTRSLFRFDLSALPTNTVVLSAAVQLAVTRQPAEPPTNTTFGLHRLLRDWGEGNKNPPDITGQAGNGLPASPGEATWNFAFFPTNAWTTPGGAIGVDFSATESSFQFVYGTAESPYRFESTPEMITDVTAWLRQPQSNFGWMLLCNEEFYNFTSRRWGTREDAANQPVLQLQYVIPPGFTQVQKIGTQFNLFFLARAQQNYVIQFRNSLATGSWQTLATTGPFGQDTQVLVVDTIAAPQRFYRLNTW